MRRRAAVPGILLLAALTACTDDGGPDPHPRGSTTATSAVIASHAPDVLVSVSSTGGEGSPGRGIPDVEVRADGTVFLGTDTGLGVETATLTAAGLDRVREAFSEVSLQEDDYEESAWTDQPSTSVYSTLGDRPARVSVYGFGHDDDVDDPDWHRLEAALDVLDEVAREARPAAYRPAGVVVLLSPDTETGAPWPLTPLRRIRQGWTATGQACVLATGRDVATLQAITTRHGRTGLTWAGLAVQLRPVLRDTPAGCTPAPSGRIGIGAFHRVRLAPAPHRPRPLEAWRVVDAVEEAAGVATGEEPPEGQLSSYDTVWRTGGTAHRWVEVAATYPVEFRDDLPEVPTTWRVRVDAATGEVRSVEVEGVPVRPASRG
jgi:hypothetical protein